MTSVAVTQVLRVVPPPHKQHTAGVGGGGVVPAVASNQPAVVKEVCSDAERQRPSVGVRSEQADWSAVVLLHVADVPQTPVPPSQRRVTLQIVSRFVPALAMGTKKTADAAIVPNAMHERNRFMVVCATRCGSLREFPLRKRIRSKQRRR